MPRLLPLFILTLALGVGRLVAVTLTPEAAAAMAERHNPGLQAARWRVQEARGRLLQSGRLSNPEVGMDFTRKRREPEGSVAVGVMQKFPVTQRLSLERAVSSALLDAAEAEVRDAARKLVAEVRAAAVRVLALEAQTTLRQEQVGTSRELSGFLRQRAAAGELPRFDVTQAEMEEQQLALDLTKLAAEKRAALGLLRPLLGLPADAQLGIAGQLEPLRAATAYPERGDIAAARAQVEAAARSTILVRATRWEDVGVGFSVTRERTKDDPTGFESDTVFGLRTTIALPLWNDQRGRIFEADASARRTERELAALRGRAQGEVASARAEAAGFKLVARQIEREMLPRARSAEEQVKAANTSGQAPFAEVLRARARRLELEQRRLDALRDWHLATIRLEEAAGRTPRPTQATSAMEQPRRR